MEPCPTKDCNGEMKIVSTREGTNGDKKYNNNEHLDHFECKKCKRSYIRTWKWRELPVAYRKQ